MFVVQALETETRVGIADKTTGTVGIVQTVLAETFLDITMLAFGTLLITGAIRNTITADGIALLTGEICDPKAFVCQAGFGAWLARAVCADHGSVTEETVVRAIVVAEAFFADAFIQVATRATLAIRIVATSSPANERLRIADYPRGAGVVVQTLLAQSISGIALCGRKTQDRQNLTVAGLT